MLTPARRAISVRESSDLQIGRKRNEPIPHRQARVDACRRDPAGLGHPHGRQRAQIGGKRLSLHRAHPAILQANPAPGFMTAVDTSTTTRQVTPPRPTTIVEAPRLSRKLGVDLVLASETLQYTGSFKFRAAFNVASKVKQSHVITASSGNFGQAIAYACAQFGKRCTVVMPSVAPKIKVDAVREYGAEV